MSKIYPDFTFESVGGLLWISIFSGLEKNV